MDKYLRIVAAFFAAIMAILFVAGCSADQKYKETLTSVNGVWHCDNPKLAAWIANGQIIIRWTTDDGSSVVYWSGSFPTEMSNNGRFTSVASAKDASLMNASLLGSLDLTKEFTFANGAISFSQTFAGSTHTVNLMH